ncbi:MAG: VRR-NUC domain-containing protein [Pseudomonadota bacterium]|nr:VRR-NUC domain-containing protein [Pseudomonadota bacterium]
MKAHDLVSEKQLQATVVEMALAHGWSVYGVLDQREYSKRLSKGWPDLVLVKHQCIIFAELKSEKGKVSPEQRAWLNALRTVVRPMEWGYVKVWRPSDLPTIEAMLTTKAGWPE